MMAKQKQQQPTLDSMEIWQLQLPWLQLAWPKKQCRELGGSVTTVTHGHQSERSSLVEWMTPFNGVFPSENLVQSPWDFLATWIHCFVTSCDLFFDGRHHRPSSVSPVQRFDQLEWQLVAKRAGAVELVGGRSPPPEKNSSASQPTNHNLRVKKMSLRVKNVN